MSRSTPHRGAGEKNTSRAEVEKERLDRATTHDATKGNSTSLSPIKLYLVAYNAISTALWAYILFLTISHVLTPPSMVPPKASSSFRAPLSISRIFSNTSSVLPRPITGFIDRLTGGGSYKDLRRWTQSVQSLAALEVVHAALGWVRSGVGITGLQVASRLWTVWGVLPKSPEIADSPLFTSMVFAWSVTEVVRYSFYAAQLLGIKIPGHTWLRYSTFIPLYPLGAGSEAFLSFSNLPSLATFPWIPEYFKNLSPLSSLLAWLPTNIAQAAMKSEVGRRVFWNIAKASTKTKNVVAAKWAIGDYVGLYLFVIWWPSLYMMMAHMFHQRRKVVGAGRRIGGAKTKTT